MAYVSMQFTDFKEYCNSTIFYQHQHRFVEDDVNILAYFVLGRSVHYLSAIHLLHYISKI